MHFSKIFFKINYLVAEDPKSNTSLTGIALSRNAKALLYSYMTRQNKTGQTKLG